MTIETLTMPEEWVCFMCGGPWAHEQPCPICEHCGKPSWELLPVLFGNGIEDKACKECIKVWEETP